MQSKRAVLFANGRETNIAFIQKWLLSEDYLVAVDGGLQILDELELSPKMLVGDLDSVEPTRVKTLMDLGVKVNKFPAEKDETDLELALNLVIEKGFKVIRVVNALGGRLDQILGNVLLLQEKKWASLDLRFEDGYTEVMLIPKAKYIEGQIGEIVSLIPLSPKCSGVTTEGLKYALKNENLYSERTRGISNVIVDSSFHVQCDKGILLVVHLHKQN